MNEHLLISEVVKSALADLFTHKVVTNNVYNSYSWGRLKNGIDALEYFNYSDLFKYTGLNLEYLLRHYLESRNETIEHVLKVIEDSKKKLENRVEYKNIDRRIEDNALRIYYQKEYLKHALSKNEREKVNADLKKFNGIKTQLENEKEFYNLRFEFLTGLDKLIRKGAKA